MTVLSPNLTLLFHRSPGPPPLGEVAVGRRGRKSPNITSHLRLFFYPALLMPHGVPPGHRWGIAARNAGNCVRLLWFLQADQVRKNQRTCRPSAETKDAECRRHWNTITPACELSTAAHAPLSGHCIMLPFSMGYIELYEPLPFIGDLPVQFSYENEPHP